jgi:hypothetical protein
MSGVLEAADSGEELPALLQQAFGHCLIVLPHSEFDHALA